MIREIAALFLSSTSPSDLLDATTDKAAKVYITEFLGGVQPSRFEHIRGKFAVQEWLTDELRRASSLRECVRLVNAGAALTSWAEKMYHKLNVPSPDAVLFQSTPSTQGPSLADAYSLSQSIKAAALENQRFIGSRLQEAAKILLAAPTPREQVDPQVASDFKDCIQSVSSQGLTHYRTVFEMQFLQDAEKALVPGPAIAPDFSSAPASGVQPQASVLDDSRWESYRARWRTASELLHASTVVPYMSIVFRSLFCIKDDLAQFILPWVRGRRAELQLLYAGSRSTRESYNGFVKGFTEATKMELCDAFQGGIDSVLSHYGDLGAVVDKLMQGDSLLKRRIRDAAREVLKEQPQTCNEIARVVDLAVQCSDLMTVKSVGELSSGTLLDGEHLSLCLTRGLVRRIMCGKVRDAFSYASEREALTILKKFFGSAIVHGCDVLLGDATSSDVVTAQYTEVFGAPPVKLHILAQNVAICGVNGDINLTLAQLPRPLIPVASRVHMLYDDCHPRRRLCWSAMSSSLVVGWRHAGGTSTVAMTVAHFAVLNALDESPCPQKVHVESIAKTLQIDVARCALLVKDLQSAGVLLGSPQQTGGSTECAIAPTHPLPSFAVAVLGCTSTAEKKVSRHALDAAIVRLVKKAGKCTRGELFAQLSSVAHLSVTSKDVDDSLMRLAQREFVQLSAVEIAYLS